MTKMIICKTYKELAELRKVIDKIDRESYLNTISESMLNVLNPIPNPLIHRYFMRESIDVRVDEQNICESKYYIACDEGLFKSDDVMEVINWSCKTLTKEMEKSNEELVNFIYGVKK